jgi:chromosome segregation ATPase
MSTLPPVDSRIAKGSWVLEEKEQAAAIITCVMSEKQWERDDAARKIQRHILAIEAERDAREAECEALSDRAHMAEHELEKARLSLTAAEARIAELEAKVQDKRDEYEAGWYARIEAEGKFS